MKTKIGPLDYNPATGCKAEGREREQVEYVFGLTGGELETEAWPIVYEAESQVDGKPFTPEGQRVPEHELHRSQWQYWYEGVPEYAKHDAPVHLFITGGYTLRTVVSCARYGGVRRAFHDATDGARWVLVKYYTSSGEIECPCNDTTEPRPAPCCPLCEVTEESDEHGYIYIGDGWVEAVYREEN